MIKELIKTSMLLIAMPIFTAIAMVLTAHRGYSLAVIYPVILISLALLTSSRPKVSIDLLVDKQVMYVGDELNVKLKITVNNGFGILVIRGPPTPNTESSNAFELSQGKNVHVIFKGLRPLNNEFNYKLRALRRGEYLIGDVEYTYYHALGLLTPIKDTMNIAYKVKVLPRVKIINRVPRIRLKQETPRQSPARLGPYSTEFRAVRDYLVGDPYKFINWKATARSPSYKLKVNDYEREGSRTVLFILDNGWWMRYGTYEENPLEFSMSLILSLTRALLRYGLNVGLWVPQTNIYIMPTSGSTQYFRILTGLVNLETLTIRLNWVINKSISLNTYQPSDRQSYDSRILYMISVEKPIIIYITSITKESLINIKNILSAVSPLRTVLIDVIPSTIIMSKYLGNKGIKCLSESLMFERRRLYSLIPRGIKIIPWDPLCETMGMAMVKVLNNIRVIS